MKVKLEFNNEWTNIGVHDLFALGYYHMKLSGSYNLDFYLTLFGFSVILVFLKED